MPHVLKSEVFIRAWGVGGGCGGLGPLFLNFLDPPLVLQIRIVMLLSLTSPEEWNKSRFV